jgi:hypothetical protein
MPNYQDTHTEQIDLSEADCPYCGMFAGCRLMGLFPDVNPQDIENDPELNNPIETWWECRYCGWSSSE